MSIQSSFEEIFCLRLSINCLDACSTYIPAWTIFAELIILLHWRTLRWARIIYMMLLCVNVVKGNLTTTFLLHSSFSVLHHFTLPADTAVHCPTVIPEQSCAINSSAVCVCGACPWPPGEIIYLWTLGTICCLYFYFFLWCVLSLCSSVY